MEAVDVEDNRTCLRNPTYFDSIWRLQSKQLLNTASNRRNTAARRVCRTQRNALIFGALRCLSLILPTTACCGFGIAGAY